MAGPAPFVTHHVRRRATPVVLLPALERWLGAVPPLRLRARAVPPRLFPVHQARNAHRVLSLVPVRRSQRPGCHQTERHLVSKILQEEEEEKEEEEEQEEEEGAAEEEEKEEGDGGGGGGACGR